MSALLLNCELRRDACREFPGMQRSAIRQAVSCCIWEGKKFSGEANTGAGTPAALDRPSSAPHISSSSSTMLATFPHSFLDMV